MKVTKVKGMTQSPPNIAFEQSRKRRGWLKSPLDGWALRIPLDDTIRPRDYCILNPFRNTQPERLAEKCIWQS